MHEISAEFDMFSMHTIVSNTKTKLEIGLERANLNASDQSIQLGNKTMAARPRYLLLKSSTTGSIMTSAVVALTKPRRPRATAHSILSRGAAAIGLLLSLALRTLGRNPP